MSDLSHIPVLLGPVLTYMTPANDEIYVDGTFGAGGYSRALLDRADCRMIAFDRDPEAEARYQGWPPSLKARCTFVRAPFSSLARELASRGIASVDGVVLDLGVSSPQIDNPARGFSFRFDGPLDMRMDPTRGRSAADLVNTLDETALADLIYTYGEDRKSRRIARAIVQARSESPVTTTAGLAAIIRGVLPKTHKDISDPCTRTFQALRIAVNDELGELEAALEAALQVLKPGGRLVVVTFHSLEDRIVKQFFKTHAGKTAHGSRYLPETEETPVLLDLLTPKAVEADEQEQAANPRARSARLRAARRTVTPLPEHLRRAA